MATEQELQKELDRVADVARRMLAVLNAITGVAPTGIPKELWDEMAAAKKAASAVGIRLETTL